jgi:hypothetical protein
MKRKRNRNRFQDDKDRHPGNNGIFLMIVLSSVMMSIFYLWGKIQIDLILRENGHLEQERQSIQHEIDDLQVRIDGLKGYQQIVQKAKILGLDFVSPERIEELPVDLQGLDHVIPQEENRLQYAGVEPFGIQRIIEQKYKQKYKKAGGENGMD